MSKILQCREILILGILVEQVWRNHNLIEEIPVAIIEQGALTLLGQNIIPWIVHIVWSNLTDLRFGTQHLMHTLIGRIIIHIAHYKHLHILVDAEQTILDSLGLASTRLPIERTRETAWPVTNDDSHILTSHFTTNSEETASIISTILSLLLNIRH